MPSGIITKGIGGFYYVASEDAEYECKARGIFRKNGLTPLPGDKVIFSVTDPVLKKGSLDEIMERSSLLARPAVANIDQLVAVIAVKSPEPDMLLLDKLLITAETKSISAVICINKTDLDTEGKSSLLRSDYAKAGYSVIETSSKINNGFDNLKSVLNGKISVFAGQSGVGKSTMLNNIVNTMMMKTGGLSDKIDRGKHTTRHTELIMLEDGGYVADTPGFSSFEMTGIEYAGLQFCYYEFRDYIKECRFTGCSHINEPECGVKNAAASGEISAGRYERYIEIYKYLKQLDSMKYKK